MAGEGSSRNCRKYGKTSKMVWYIQNVAKKYKNSQKWPKRTKRAKKWPKEQKIAKKNKNSQKEQKIAKNNEKHHKLATQCHNSCNDIIVTHQFYKSFFLISVNAPLFAIKCRVEYYSVFEIVFNGLQYTNFPQIHIKTD